MTLKLQRPSKVGYFVAALAVLAAGTARATTTSDVRSTLGADPQFSDFVMELKQAGLWSTMGGLQNVTVFAPTNAAFDRTDRAWRTEIESYQNFDGNGAGFAWQDVLRGAFIRGVHAPNEFQGKAQVVHSTGTVTYWVDGRDGSTIRVQTKQASTGEMGATVAPAKTAMLAQPIAANGGLIYPMDAVVH
jgi:hypothetical protein